MHRKPMPLSLQLRKLISGLAVLFLVGGTTTYIAGVAQAVTPIPDTAISMTGSNQLKAENAALVPTSGSFTYQTWFNRRTGSGQYSMLYSQGTSGNIFYVQVVGTGSTSGIYWNYGGFGGNFGWDIPNNHWAHVSFVYSESADKKANSVKIYVNGSLSYTWNAGSNYLANTATTSNFKKSYIAGYSYADSYLYRFTGQIDETRIYNKALTQAEVQSSMHSYANVSDPNLRAYYDFNDVSGDLSQAMKNKSTSAAKAPDSDFVELHTGTAVPTLDPIAKVATVNNQKYVAFTKSYISSTGGWEIPQGAASINYLVVGGGGAGGARHGGGGGAGAALDAVNVPVTAGTKIDVQVGGGGLAATSGDGNNGGESKISGTTFQTVAPGGGAGGGGGRAGLKGASGGGGGAAWGAGTDGTAGFGNKGGNARFYRYDNGGENWQGGGGGGAGTAGTAPTGNGDGMRSGSGGTGKTFSWFNTIARNAFPAAVLTGLGQADGTSVYFAGGGSGGRLGWGYSGYPGLGGGGLPYTSGLPNSGSGGGGGNGGTSGYGGTGVVIVSYSTTPNVPRDFTARPITNSQVDLAWTEPLVNGATISQYQIEYSLTSDFASKKVEYLTPVAGSATQKYSVTGLTDATNYFFRVAAKNASSIGTFTTGAPAKTWYKIEGTGESAVCVDYVSTNTGVTTELNAAKDSCVVTFTSGSTEWAVPVGVTKLDSLVVGGGGGGGPSAGSGGSGGSVADLRADLGASKITKFNVSVGAGGAAATAGVQSTLSGTDGTNSISVTSPGGKAGASGTGTVLAGTAPTVTPAGTNILVTERIKSVGGVGGAGTTSSTTGNNAVGGYSPASAANGSVFTGGYAGGGGGGAVVSGVTTISSTTTVPQTVSLYVTGGSISEFAVPLDWELKPPHNQLYTAGGPVVYNNDFKVSRASPEGSWPSAETRYYNNTTRKHIFNVLFDTTVDGFAWNELAYVKGSSPLSFLDTKTAKTYVLESFSWSLEPTGVAKEYTKTINFTTTESASGTSYQSTSAGAGSSGGGASASHTASADVTTRGTLTPAQSGTPGTGGGGGAGISSGSPTLDVGAAGGSGVVKIQYQLVNPPIVVTSPEDATVPVGDSVSFSASFATEVTEIRWQVSTNAGITWTNISGATTANSASSVYTISNTTDPMNGNRYRAVGKNQKGSAFAEAPTLSAFLTVTRDAETLPAGAFCDGTSTQNGLTTSAGHGKVFYIDTGQGQEIDAGYVAYTVNSTSARGDLWVELSGFSGGVISLADPSTSSMPLGPVAENGQGTAFFMLKAKAATLTAQSHVLRIYNQKPSIGNPAPIYECNFSFTRVEETIKAAANKVDSVISSSVSSIGSTMTVTVKGDSGTIGQGNDIDGRMFWLIPAARSSWPVNAVRLEKTNLSLYTTQANRDAGTSALKSFDNTLRVNDSNGFPANTRQFWTATYTFRIIGPASAPAPIIPIAMISSGTQIKHTDVAGLTGAGGQVLDLSNPTPTIDLKVTKNVNPQAQVRDDGTTRFEYEIALTNEGDNELVVDEVVDTPDVKASYVTGSASYNDVAIRDPGKIGTTNQVAFSGPLVLPANSVRIIKYSMAIETCKAGQSYSLQNTATARSGTIVIGSGSATQSVVTINANCGEQDIDVFVEDVPLPPDVTTGVALDVAQTTAEITGSIDPNGVAGRDLRFQYSTSSTLASPTVADVIADTTTGTAAYSVSADLTGLTPNTTYYYRLEVLVGSVWKLGEILSFTTDPAPSTPVANTLAVSDIVSATVSRVTFNGTIDANQVTGGAKVKFEYGEKILSNGSLVCPTSGTLTGFMQTEKATLGTFEDSVTTGSGPTPFNFVQDGLKPNTGYCVRIIAYYGTDFATPKPGDWVSFTTLDKTPQDIIWKTGTDPLPAKGTTTVEAFAESTLPVVYTSVDPLICTVHPTSGLVTAVATSGNCVITATQVGNDQFYEADPATISFLITAPMVETTSLPTGTYNSSYSQTLDASGGTRTYTKWTFTGALPPGLTLSNNGVITGTPTEAGIFTIFVTVTDTNGVPSEPQPLTITINKIKVDVTASSFVLTYGDGAPTVTATFDESQLVGSDTTATLLASPNIGPTCSTNYTRGMPAGDVSAYTTCAGGWATNYTFAFVQGTITINPLEVTIKAIDVAKTSGSPDPSFKYSVSPALPAGQTLSNVIEGGAPTLTRANPSSEDVGRYTITPTATLVRLPYRVTADDGTESTVYRSNYSLKVVTGALTITAKITPTLETSNKEITFGDDLTGKLDALAKNGADTVPGTYRYYYLDSSGSEVTINSLTKLPAGTYTILVSFTPADSQAFHGPIQGSFSLLVKPFAITLTALDAAKQNLESTSELIVNSDPKLHYSVHPKLPAGQTLADVFSNGVKVNRDRAGTAAGNYPKVNTAIKAKEGLNTTHPVRPNAEYSPNYAVTMVNATLTVTGLKVPDVLASDSTKIINQTLGERLKATPVFDGLTVPGELEFSYLDAAGTKVIATPATALPLGLHSLVVKFTPTDSATYFGPVYSSMFVTVTPFVPSGGGGGGGVAPAVTPEQPKPSKPKPKPGPGNAPDGINNGGGSIPGANNPGGNPGSTPGGPNSGPGSINDPNKNGPYARTTPSIPGFGSLVPRITPTEPSESNATGAPGQAPSVDTDAWNKMISTMTLDFGQGVQEATGELASGGRGSLTQANRSLAELSAERLGGFYPPGSGVRIEVLGARTGARFILSDISQIDSQALLLAMTNSIQAQKTDFFTIQNIMIDKAPIAPEKWTEEEQLGIDEFFAGAGLEKPISLADIDFDEVKNWVGIEAWATTYVPGSVVYLTATSSPLVIASAVADSEGRVMIEGAVPVEYLGAGEHRIRLVGTRSLDGVFVDDNGEIQVTDETMTEIERFDLQTQATIAFVGSNEQGGNHVAMRVIPLIPSAPWWTVILLGLAGLLVLVLRRRSLYFVDRSRIIGPIAIAIAAVPGVILGWLSSVTEVVWVTLVLALVLAAASWLIRPRSKSR